MERFYEFTQARRDGHWVLTWWEPGARGACVLPLGDEPEDELPEQYVVVYRRPGLLRAVSPEPAVWQVARYFEAQDYHTELVSVDEARVLGEAWELVLRQDSGELGAVMNINELVEGVAAWPLRDHTPDTLAPVVERFVRRISS